MPWLAEAFQDFRARGTTFKERVREQTRFLAARPAQESPGATVETILPADEAEGRVEAEAKKLSHPVQAAEVLLRWLSLLRSTRARYTDKAPASPGSRLTFRQVFLRSRALELAIQAASRSPELRASLRQHGLTTTEVWPADLPPPMAFARAFLALLHTCVGPSETWLGLLAALLSSEKVSADEQCSKWLVELIASRRLDWELAVLEDRQKVVEAMEAAAEEKREEPSVFGAGALAPMLTAMSQRSRASGSALNAWSQRRALGREAQAAAARARERAEASAKTAAAVSEAAASRAVGGAGDGGEEPLPPQACGVSAGLINHVEDLRKKFSELADSGSRLQREIEDSEATHRELLRQVALLAENIEGMKRKRVECQRQRDLLAAEMRRAEKLVARQQEDEDEAKRQLETARALALTVSDLAAGIASATPWAEGHGPILAAAKIQDRSEQHSRATAWQLGQKEVDRLQALTALAASCRQAAEDRVKSRVAMENLGVPTATLESDIVGQAEIVQALRATLSELSGCRLSGALDDLLEVLRGDAASSELVEQLQQCLTVCDAEREKLLEIKGLIDPADCPEEGEDLTVDAFLQSAGVTIVELGDGYRHAQSSDSGWLDRKHQGRNGYGSGGAAAAADEAVSGMKSFLSLAARVVATPAAASSRGPGRSPRGPADDDPFLLQGAEEIDRASAAAAAAAAAASAAASSSPSPLTEEASPGLTQPESASASTATSAEEQKAVRPSESSSPPSSSVDMPGELVQVDTPLQ